VSDQPPSEQSIFLAAIDQVSAAARAAYLDQACAGNPRFRAEVEALLAAHDRLGSLAPAVDPGAASKLESSEVPGTLLGPYKLLQQIGEGGMGTVWMAEQTHPVKRKVAVKVIKPGMDSGQIIARFEAERQALALMDHPNIARVLDAGTIKCEPGAPSPTLPQVPGVGRPYFVMELVKGMPLTTYCDEYHLTPRQRLELFVPVCQALQHAHTKGIIHRDLKPSNVLIALYDGQPVPKVIDFGVAKATGRRLTERTLFTEFGAVVGTLEYMSPEQAELNQLDIDTRSDIYSLGVLLYELLTGTTPLQRKRVKEAAFLEVLRLIREEEPPRPSTRLSTTEELPRIAANRGLEPKQLSGLVRGELDWIVMKALDKDRSRRYETANDLARDITRYLHDEPVHACPASAGYRLRKLVRRHQGSVLAAAVVLLALLGGIVGTTLGLVEAQRQRDTADQARLDEIGARQSAEAQRDRAVKAESEARANELKARAEQAKAKEQEARARNSELKAKAEEDRAKEQEARAKISELKALQKEAQARASEAQALAVLAFFQDNVLAAARPKDQAGGLGFGATIRAAVDAAEPLIARAFREQPLVEASVRGAMGLTYLYLGQAKRSVRQHERALELLQAQLGRAHPNTLRSMSNLAVAYQAAGRLQEALPLHEKALKLFQVCVGPEHPDTMRAMNNLAAAYKAAGRLREALSLYEQALKLFQTHLGPEHPDTLHGMNNLAHTYLAVGRLAEALPLYEQTLKLRQTKLGPEHQDTLTSMSNLAHAYNAAGRLPEALGLYEQTLTLRQLHLGANHPHTLTSMNNLAYTYKAAGRLPEALPLYEQALTLRQLHLGADHPDTLSSMNNLAAAYQAAGRLPEALPLYEQALTLRQLHLGADHPDTVISMANLARGYEAAGRLQEALPWYEQTLKLRQAQLGARHPDTLRSMNNLALAYMSVGRLNDAEPLWRELAALWKEQTGPDSLSHGRVLANLGLTRLRQHKYGDAEPALRDALAIHAKQQPTDWTTFHLMSLLGASLVGQRKYAQAEALLLQSYQDLKQRAATISPQSQAALTETLGRMVQLYAAWGKKHLAAHWHKQLRASR
jgi:serine/threonine protein kinase/tetratricopeptide (TPR) repeat protein